MVKRGSQPEASLGILQLNPLKRRKEDATSPRRSVTLPQNPAVSTTALAPINGTETESSQSAQAEVGLDLSEVGLEISDSESGSASSEDEAN